MDLALDDVVDLLDVTDLRDLEVHTSDGVTLSARLFAPRAGAVGAAIIVPAMGVPQRYYEAFAKWLSRQHLYVLTFDYRGMGLSRQGPLGKLDADILTWAERDTAAAVEALMARAGGLPLTWIGHSLGGQILPFVPNRDRAAKVITIATGSGYWRDNSPALRRKVLLMWFGAVPLATPLFGYFPGRRLRMVGDLPRGVVQQWRRWCLHPEYAVGVEEGARERFAAVTTPITSFSFTDDEMMSERSIDTLHGFYTSAPKAMHRFRPRELGLRRIGHFGFFRAEMESPLWQAQVAPELARVGGETLRS